ncbi:DSBA oxidoreductase [Caldalkalibacillus thermarum TA2.A1]|uniref:DSBA oxidoreductase n=1 Tax=Caldalkalibacillus thermarum (strain TA2.A1) TaxID=986075 RepID=F5L5C8_CALTT|nr:thioredoxin domain-containing protein [Caldalkalibacillus thermarum]EGL83463.1 DSBA oxidoreductase [Caldalkalibacillus thermarum TA2.A1]QZT34928.1 DsbA family protein [Caldalkalibacillus thermarum TA2.A1]
MAQQNKLARTLVLFTAIFAVLIVLLIMINRITANSPENIMTDMAPPVEGQPLYGDPEAKVNIIVFSDYLCSACKVWHEHIFPRLKAGYVEDGTANIVHINSLFHGEQSLLASLASEAAWAQDQEGFWAFHDALYDHQPAEHSETAWVTAELLLEIAESVPLLSAAQLIEDVLQQTFLPEVEEDMRMVRDYQIQYTPSVMVNNVLLADPFDYDELVNVIERALTEESS